jgi:hypothetical protein
MELSSMEDVSSWLRRLRPGEDLDPVPDRDPVPDPDPDPAAVPDPVGAATKEGDPNPDHVADPLRLRTERILEAVLGPDLSKRGMTAKMGIGNLDPDPVGDHGIVRIQEIERIPDLVLDPAVL